MLILKLISNKMSYFGILAHSNYKFVILRSSLNVIDSAYNIIFIFKYEFSIAHLHNKHM